MDTLAEAIQLPMSFTSRFFGRNTKMKNNLRRFSVQVLDASEYREIVGTGIICQPDGQILTCAHVVRDAAHVDQIIEDVEVYVRFHREQVRSLESQLEYKARVVHTLHRIYDNRYYDDITILKLIDVDVAQLLVSSQWMARLGPAVDSSGNRFRSYGYGAPDSYTISSHLEGKIQGLVEGPRVTPPINDIVELSADSVVHRGMSGAAILDINIDRVVGLVSHHLSQPVRVTSHGRVTAYGPQTQLVLDIEW